MKVYVTLEKTKSYLPILVAEVETKTLKLLSIHSEHGIDQVGQLTGFYKCTDVYGNKYSFPNESVLKVTECFATKCNTKNGTVWVRHPAVQKWDGQEFIPFPSKIVFAQDPCDIECTWVYKNPEYK